MDYDLKIVGGTIVDGSGRERYRGDVGVRGGKVVALGRVEGSAVETLDAGGLAVAPGFVDIHTHYDAQLFWDPELTISPWHGVTSVVVGNCGFGIAPTSPPHRDLVLRTLEGDRVAVITAEGNILPGEQPPGTIGGDSLATLIRDTVEEEGVKAIVLRINSGGGSMFASEIIRQQILHAREKKIPIVVSMGTVAASGGYYIAANADEIWATPSTLTPSVLSPTSMKKPRRSATPSMTFTVRCTPPSTSSP